jgi:hypothetical protein
MDKDEITILRVMCDMGAFAEGDREQPKHVIWRETRLVSRDFDNALERLRQRKYVERWTEEGREAVFGLSRLGRETFCAGGPEDDDEDEDEEFD